MDMRTHHRAYQALDVSPLMLLPDVTVLDSYTESFEIRLQYLGAKLSRVIGMDDFGYAVHWPNACIKPKARKHGRFGKHAVLDQHCDRYCIWWKQG
ncbi:hypothetical protein D3C77_630640 [compost metagenome]